MLIDYEIFKWLVDSNIIIRPEKPNVRADTKVELDQRSSIMVRNGMIFTKLIRMIKRQAQTVSKVPLQTPPNLKHLKDGDTAGTRVYNWNIIVDALLKLNYRIDNDIKALIIAGDEDMVLEVLKEVYRFIMKFNKLGSKDHKTTSSASSIASSDVVERLQARFPTNRTLAEHVTSPTNYSKQLSSYKALHGKSGLVNLELIDIDTPIEDTGSVMELLIVSLSKSLSLNSKQSMALLTNGNKYLAHVIAKGIKGNFDPVLYWYKELYAQAKHILQLVIKEESTGSVPTILQALKPGLYSKSEEVAQWACRLLSKIAFDFSNVELLPAAWEWFTSTNGGLYAFLACLKRHPDAGPYIVAAVTQFSRYNMLELFTVEMKKIFVDPLEYIQNILLMLKPLTEAKLSKDELLNHSIVDFFLDMGLKNAESPDRSAPPQLRSAALSLLCDLWEIYPAKIEEQEGLPNQILMVCKRGIRDSYTSLKVTSITYLFRLLENFAAERNPFAPIVYKILTFSLIEHHEDQSIREILILNFEQIFKNFSTIPVGVLLEPLVKQIQVSEGTTYIMNLFDFRLLDTLANHPKLALKQGIQLLDVFAKTYLNNVAFAYLAGPPFAKIAERFIEEDTMQEYLLEFAKLALSKYYTSVKRKKTKDNFVKKFIYMEDRDDLFTGPTNITPEMEQEILNAQKRALTINLLRDLINLQSSILNAKYKTLLVYTNSQIKQLTRHDNKGIKFLLSLFGDADEIIKQYHEEANPAHDKKMVDYKSVPPTEYLGASGEINRASIVQSDHNVKPVSPRYSDRGMDQNSKLNITPSRPKAGGFESSNVIDDGDELFGSNSPYAKMQNNRYEDENRGDSWNDADIRIPLELARSNSLADGEFGKMSEVEKVTNNKAKAKEVWDLKKKEKIANEAQRLLKAMEQLEEIKKKRVENKMTKEMFDEYKKLKEEKTKESLKKKIDQRRVELGVQPKTNNYLIKEDESQVKESVAFKKKPQDVENVAVVDLEEEEYFQKETMAIYIKQNIKKFRYLFTKYCVTGAAYQKEKSFDKLRVQYNTINQVAILRMIKDNTLHTLISKEEAIQLFKLVNTKLLGNQDLQPFNFEGFTKFVVQLAIYVYTRPPLDQVHPVYVDCVKKLMFVIYLAAQGRGEQKLMLEEIPVGENRQEMEMLNHQLQENPNMSLPPGYRRVVENTFEYDYGVPSKLQVPEKFKIAHEILDQILHKQFGFHIIEPKMHINTYIKALPQVRAEVVVPANKAKAQVTDRELSGDRGRSNDFDKSKANRSNREMSVDRISMKAEPKILNKAVEERLKRAEEEKRRQEEQDRRIKQRKMEIEAQIKELAEVKKNRDLMKDQEKKLELMMKEEEEKQKEEKRRRELEKKKQMLKEYKEKKDMETKQQEEIEKIQTDKKDEQRKEKTIQVKKKTENVQKQLEDKIKKREEEEKKRLEKNEEEKKKADLAKKRLEIKIEKEREKREREKEVTAQLVKLFESPAMQEFYTQNFKRLNIVFKHYKENPDREVMSFKEFMTFSSQLNVFPSLISSEEVKLIFRSLTRNKTGDIGLTYNDFLQGLLRVAAKSHPVLNRVAENLKHSQGVNLGQDIVRDMVNRTKQAIGQVPMTKEQEKEIQNQENYDRNTVDKEAEDVYQGILDVRKETMEGLVAFLGLPEDQKELKDKLKSLRTENQKIVAPRDKKRAALMSMGLNATSFSPPSKDAPPKKPAVRSPKPLPIAKKVLDVNSKGPNNQGPPNNGMNQGLPNNGAYPQQYPNNQQYPQNQGGPNAFQQGPGQQQQPQANNQTGTADPNNNKSPENTEPPQEKKKGGWGFNIFGGAKKK